MNLSSIIHHPLTSQAFGVKPRTLVMRIKAAKDDLDNVSFSYADTAHPGHPVPFTTVKMKKLGHDDWYDYFECRLIDIKPRLVYYFTLDKDAKRLYYTADRFYDKLPLERNDYYKFPYFLESEIIDVPSWYTQGIVYNIFLDSFNPYPLNKQLSHKQRLGGILESVLEKLDYFVDLGVTCLYFNPLFTANTYHKYDTEDYFTIDPSFGDNRTFKMLVEAAHERGLKIVIDGVFNHSGEHFMPFKEWIDNPQGKFQNWFFQVKDALVKAEQSGEDISYACFGYEKHMPKLNLSHPPVQKYFLNVATYWMKEFNIDGWRLDVADEVAPSFWRKFREHIKTINPEAVLIGEIWQSAPSYMDGSLFDGLMNYDLLKHIKSFFTSSNPDAKSFGNSLFQLTMRYREQHVMAQLNFLDTHDVVRFFSLIQGDQDRYRCAWVFLMTFMGVPMIFYGDEAPLEGIREEDYRQALNFQKPFLFHRFLRELISLRKKYPVLRDGKFRVSSKTQGSTLVFERFNEQDSIHVIIHLGDESIKVPHGNYLAASRMDHTTLKSGGFLIYKEVSFERNNS